MRVLVTGSTVHADLKGREVEFAQACRELGAALARAGHSFVAGSHREGVADLYVLEGANSVDGRHSVHVYRPEQGETPYDDVRERFDRLDLHYAGRRGDLWSVARVAQILAADGVIVIGGSEGTMQVGATAPLLHVPVLAVPSFGGSARRVWEDLQGDYQRLPALRPMLGALRERWRSETAPLVIKALEELVTHNPYRQPTGRVLPLMSLVTALLLVTWVVLFVDPPLDRNASFFPLLAVAALAGAALRSVLRLLQQQRQLEGRTILAEATAALLLAFGLALAYMAGGLTVTGSPDFLELSRNSDYQRVGIVMSVLGLGAGFLIEQGSARLERLLDRTMLREE